MRFVLASVVIGISCFKVVAADLPPLTAVFVEPEIIELLGPDSLRGLLVHGTRADGSTIDLTHVAQYRSDSPQHVSVSKQGVATAVSDGQGTIVVSVADLTRHVAVTIKGTQIASQPHFENDVLPILSKYRCNSSGCHGKAEGQNGFKLSVFGFDPQADYDALTKQARGRRTFPAAAEQSLLLTKLAGRVPHGGGVRLNPDSREFKTLRNWIAAGTPRGASDAPHVVRIEVSPSKRVLSVGARQQLRVIACYSDGRKVDVTKIAKFQSNNDGLAAVDQRGLVRIGVVPGQVAVMASYKGAVDVMQALVPRQPPVAEYPELAEANFIDRLVHQKLKEINIVPSPIADDAEFMRRVYLDLVGTLPTAEEARKFLGDSSSKKRAILVDELLERPEYADFWALKWSDTLRVDRRSLGHKRAYSYYGWIRQSLAQNKPLDQFVREILTLKGNVTHSPQANFYSVVGDPGSLASTVSQVFLGVRIACAQCHHHPFDRWSQTDYYGMSAFFQQVSRKGTPRGEIMTSAGNPETKHPRTGALIYSHALGTEMPDGSPAGDRRVVLADWMTSADNPWFARNAANRLWAHLMGRGLVEPVDDFRDTNPPSNPELLDSLAQQLIESGYDRKALIRTIVASNSYQRSAQPNDTNVEDEQNYSRALLKRIDAEVLLDAICQVTDVKEKFRGVPFGSRAIQLWDSEVDHYFLTLFGRPARKTACQCERNSEPTVGQVLHVLNSPEIHDKLAHDGGTIASLVETEADDQQLADELYLTFFARLPNSDERRTAVEYLSKEPGQRREAAEDLAWSLMNSLEFFFNH